MSIRILVTNDDGINAPGLKVLEEIALELTGSKDKITTIAPATDQSGVAHSISYLRPSLITEFGPNRYSVEGSPADCVLAGIHYILKDNKPDLVLSGINKGHNISEDILYSGTVGAAVEGTLQQVNSIALSQYYSKNSVLFSDPFASSREWGHKVIKSLLKVDRWHSNDYGLFYNINFPAVKANEVQKIVFTKQGKRKRNTFSVEKIKSPNGRSFLFARHQPDNTPKNNHEHPISDINGIINGNITITPLKLDMTAYQEFLELESKFEYELSNKKT